MLLKLTARNFAHVFNVVYLFYYISKQKSAKVATEN